ncbi:MAG: hypothetical protein LQ338_006226 [Usnochroma carphineum]|nr:MAG: hypothetical protein LQ338_006226 [Usnochroma carphineum]
MRTPTSFLPLFPLLLPTLISSLTIPDNARLSEPISPHNLTNPTANFACAPNPPYRTAVFPHIENCASALRALPLDTENGVFHNGGPGDGFQLPVFERYRDCEVLVELKDPRADPVASWAEIGLAGMELNLACLISYSANVGGTTVCGGGGMIRVSLRGFARRGVGDATTSAAS